MGWDDPYDEEMVAEWLDWTKDLPDLKTIKVPRCLKKMDGEPIRQELHTFADASTKAYCAVSYVVSYYERGEVVSRICMAKARVCPIKHTSVPRLELVAGYAAIRLAAQANKALKFEQKDCYYWTDSKNVFYWVTSSSREVERFVANRVGRILELSDADNWRWVPTDENPADIGSRGSTVKDLAVNKLWWEGPDFLITGKWPERPPLAKDRVIEPEAKVGEVFVAKELNNTFRIDRFGSYRSLVRFVTLAMFWKKKALRKAAGITSMDLWQKAEEQVFRLAQQESYPEEIRKVRADNEVLTTSSIFKLQPILDEGGVLRVNARLREAQHLTEDARLPIILHSAHPLSELIVRSVHVDELKHTGGRNHLLAEINKRFWILGARRLIRRVLSRCVYCKRITSKPRHQAMAPLPDFRIADAKERLEVFSTTGLDCAGPFYTKQGRARARGKRYLLLFTCAQYRAVHFEMLYGLDTDSFLRGLERFLARRVRPKRIISDNGTNFKAAETELKALWSQIDEDEIRKRYPSIEWKFNTPKASHTGGLFERMIRSAKESLYKVLPGGEVGDDELTTALTQVEGMLNNRPLTYVSTDTKDAEPLTPAHFLRGQEYSGLIPLLTDERSKYAARWRHLSMVMDHFWVRFMREFIPQLQKQDKWLKGYSDPAIGDVVCVLEEKDKGKWPLGRIISLGEPQGGRIRTVDVDFNGRVLSRPIHQIIPLLEQEID
jgi:hypothetical protein